MGLARPTQQAVRRKAIAYIRVSLAREIMVSPEQQRFAIDEWALRNDAEIVAYVIETDKTGRTFAKRRIAEIIERIRAGEADCVVVWKFSRFGRNATACGVHNDLLSQAGGHLVSATQPVDTSTPYGQFFLRMYFSMDELESDVIGLGWRDTHERRLREGLPHTGQARFGYTRCEHCERKPERPKAFKWCDHCKGILVIDPVRGPALAEAYQRYVDGESLASIAKDLFQRGIRSLKGKPLGPDGLRQAMDSGFAAGLIRRRSETSEKPPSGRPDEYDVWVPGVHDALITIDLWEKYKLRRLDGAQPTAKRTDERIWKYSLSGLLKCGATHEDHTACMRSMNAHLLIQRGKRVTQFRCPAKTELHICPGVSVTLSAAEKQVYQWLVELADDDSAGRAAYRAAQKSESRTGDLAVLEREITVLQRKIGRNKEAYLGEAIDLEEFKETREKLTAELSLHEQRKRLLEAAMHADGPPEPHTIAPLLSYWPQLPPHDRRLALAKLIRHVIVNPTPLKHTPSQLLIVPHWAALPE